MTTSNKKLHPSFALTPQSPRRAFFKKAGVAALMLSGLSLAKAASPNAASSVKNSSSQSIYKKQIPANKDSGEGRLFPKSDKVVLQKVRFKNLYDMQVVGNLFIPKGLTNKASAIITGHPMGATKEQSASLYALKMAELGFITLAIDLSFWGESEGEPRNSVCPDIYADCFSAAADYLSTLELVDSENIGVIGVCGSGSFALAAAKLDPRLKAIATVSMYDMGAANRDGLNKSVSLAQRKQIIAAASKERLAEFKGAKTAYTSGTTHELRADTDAIQREFYAFYRTSRGEFTPTSGSKETTTHPTLVSNVKFMSFYPFNDLELIAPRPLLFISGDKAHSREFSEDAYKRASEPKELFWVSDAGHVDLYDRVDKIPFAKLESFFKKHLS